MISDKLGVDTDVSALDLSNQPLRFPPCDKLLSRLRKTSSVPHVCVSEGEYCSAHCCPCWSGRGGPGTGQLWSQRQCPVSGNGSLVSRMGGGGVFLHLHNCSTPHRRYIDCCVLHSHTHTHTLQLGLDLLLTRLLAVKQTLCANFPRLECMTLAWRVGHCGLQLGSIGPVKSHMGHMGRGLLHSCAHTHTSQIDIYT